MNQKKTSFHSKNFNSNLDLRTCKTETKSESSMGTILMGVSVVIIVSSITFIGTIITADSSTSGAEQKFNYFANEKTPIARDYKKNPLRSNAAFGAAFGSVVKLKINLTDTGFDAIDSELHERCLKPKFPRLANDVMRMGYIAANPKQSASYISCSMNIQKSRLCDSYYRKRLATRLSDTIKKDAKNKAFIKKALKSKGNLGYTTRMAKKIADGNNSQKNGGIQQGRNTGPVITTAIGQKITELSMHGLLKASDFGLSIFAEVPKELKAYMVEQTVEVCPSSWF